MRKNVQIRLQQACRSLYHCRSNQNHRRKTSSIAEFVYGTTVPSQTCVERETKTIRVHAEGGKRNFV